MLLQSLITFCRVVDEGSFTKAAQSLNLSQPTVTKQVQRLEAGFDTELIDRTQRQVALTIAGQVVYGHAQRIITILRKCREELASVGTPGRGRLHIGAVPTIALYTLPRVIDHFTDIHPLVALHVRSGVNKEVINLVLQNDVDIGFTTIPSIHSHIVTRPLFDDPVLLVASPQMADQYDGMLQPEQLSSVPMIAYERRSQFRSFIESAFEATGITPNIVMEFDSHEAVKTMAQLGLGIAMVPQTVVRDDLQTGQLALLKIDGFPAISRTTSVVWRRDKPQIQSLNNFITLLDTLYPLASSPPVLDGTHLQP